MSLIEKAVERLERLKQAAGDGESGSGKQPADLSKQEHDQNSLLKTPAFTDANSKSASGSVFVTSEEQKTSKPQTSFSTKPVSSSESGSAAVASASGLDPKPEVEASFVPMALHVDIDLHRLADMHMVTPDRSNSRVAEQFRVIKRPIIENAKGLGAAPVKNGNLIMVTSSLPGEGKSFTAINLAISMAMELDYTVLLVDADFSKPSVLRYLGLPQQRGLMDVLTGEVDDLAEVMLRTSIEKLTLLPAGFSHPRATELIASEAMGRMLNELSKRYPDRIVVFDSPPLIPTTEARVLAARVGQIVMVVEADRTSQGAVKAALAMIEACPIKLMMLNKTAVQSTNDFYGYGGYGYGYGADGKPEAVS